MRPTIPVTLAAACLAATPLAAQETDGTGADSGLAETLGIEPGPAEFHDIEIEGLSAEALIGSEILGSSGDKIGEVADILIIEGETDKIVMAVRFGLGTRSLLLPFDEVEVQKTDSGDFRVLASVTEETIDRLAEYEAV